jgi:hypothetical protein
MQYETNALLSIKLINLTLASTVYAVYLLLSETSGEVNSFITIHWIQIARIKDLLGRPRNKDIARVSTKSDRRLGCRRNQMERVRVLTKKQTGMFSTKHEH